MSWCYNETVNNGQQACFNFCGGTIYNETTIITAAHCCNGISQDEIGWPDRKIVAGQLDLLTSSGLEQTRRIKSYAIRPDYDPSSSNSNDICILFLDSSMTFNEYVNKVPLDTMGPTTKETCIVSGWGTLQVKYNPIWRKYLSRTFLEIKGRWIYCKNSSMGRSDCQIRFWMPNCLFSDNLQSNNNVLRFRLCK